MNDGWTAADTEDQYLCVANNDKIYKTDAQGREVDANAWVGNDTDVNLTYRNATAPNMRNDTVGFRCAKDTSSK